MGVISFLKSTTTSFPGNVVFFELVCGLPMAAVFIILNYTEGTLSVGSALWVIVLGLLFGLAIAVPVWFFITRPMIRARQDRSAKKSGHLS